MNRQASEPQHHPVRPGPSGVTLDYSSPGIERQRDIDAIREHREKVEMYNLSTFGERRPIANMFWRIAVVAIVAVLVSWPLPKRAGRTASGLVVIAGTAWVFQWHRRWK